MLMNCLSYSKSNSGVPSIRISAITHPIEKMSISGVSNSLLLLLSLKSTRNLSGAK